MSEKLICYHCEKEVEVCCNVCIPCHDQQQKELDKHRWIPVAERLPEDKESVDIYLDNGNRVTCFNFTEHWETRFAPLNITHWKPIILPESEAKE